MSVLRKYSLPDVDLPDWADLAARRRVFEPINANQVSYRSHSQVNPTGAAAPTALAALMDEALEGLSDRVGNIDAWVGDCLGWTQKQLGERLASEQVDAVALGMDSMERGEGGFLVADVTGFGKGRIAAALASRAVLLGRPVIFFTEKANLFSDFYRDIRNIGSSELFRKPFVLNAGARVTDTASSEGRIIFPALKKAEVDRVIREGLGPDVKLVLTTYSQFNRKGFKTEFLERAAQGAHFLMDEGHNQAGDSSTSKNLAPALERAASSTYSTATAGRDVVNLVTYRKVFPWLSGLGDVETLTPSQRRAIAEASVKAAAGMGRLVRREHDLSNMRLNLVEDTRNLERNTVLADRLAPILSRMAKLSNKVYATVERRNEDAKEGLAAMPPGQRKGNSEFWFAPNFGSRLNNLIGQFLVALKVDATVEACVNDIAQGIKPVVVIQSTMESLMRELSKDPEGPEGDPDEDNLEDIADEAAEEPSAEEAAIMATTRPPTYGEALRVMAGRLLRVSVRRGGPDGEKEVVELDDPAMISQRDEIIALAAEFPELSLSPIDDIRDRVEAEGRRRFERGEIARPWVADEVSARALRVRGGKYVPAEARERNVSVARFQNGETDMLVLTNAASTGLSLHDAPECLQHARRRMYELFAPRNVIQRIQMWGRVFRRGQLTEPEFFMLSSGLDAEVFDLAIQNRKVQGLSASVTGNAASGVVVAARDYEDRMGNDIAYDILMENPHLADSMAISLRVPKEEGDASLYWISKQVRRLWLLQSEERHLVQSTLADAYEERLAAGGRVEGSALAGIWKCVGRKLLQRGDGSGDPMTGGDVYVSDIETDRMADPIGSEEINWLIAQAKADYVARLRDLPGRLLREGDATINAMRGRRWKTVQQALAEKDDNPVKRMHRTVAELRHAVRTLAPGISATLPGEDGDPVHAVVVDVRFPPEGVDPFSPRLWAVSYAVPGEDELRVVTLDVVMRDPKLRLGDPKEGKEHTETFDEAPRGRVRVRRRILDGSPIAAVMASVRLRAGSRATYEDAYGNIHDAVLLPRSATGRVLGLSGVAATPKAVGAVLAAGGRLIGVPADPATGVELRPYKDGKVLVSVPSGNKYTGLNAHPALVEVVGDWHEYGKTLQSVVSGTALPHLMAAFRQTGVVLHYDAEYRDAALRADTDRIIEPVCPPRP